MSTSTFTSLSNGSQVCKPCALRNNIYECASDQACEWKKYRKREWCQLNHRALQQLLARTDLERWPNGITTEMLLHDLQQLPQNGDGDVSSWPFELQLAHVRRAFEKVYRFQCEICSERFKLKHHLMNQHMPTHREIVSQPVLECTVCSKTFNTYGAYSVHMKVSHRINGIRGIATNEATTMFPCADCSRRFLYEAHLQHHIRKYHTLYVFLDNCFVHMIHKSDDASSSHQVTRLDHASARRLLELNPTVYAHSRLYNRCGQLLFVESCQVPDNQLYLYSTNTHINQQHPTLEHVLDMLASSERVNE